MKKRYFVHNILIYKRLMMPVLLLIISLFLVFMLFNSKMSLLKSSKLSLENENRSFVKNSLLSSEIKQWNNLSIELIARYDGLRSSGQLGGQTRLTWLNSIESLPQKYIKIVNLQFSQRRDLVDRQFEEWGNVSLKIQQEILQIDAEARHEWHALSWLKNMNETVLPTSLLLGCSWKLKSEALFSMKESKSSIAENEINPIHFSCKWLLLDIQEI